MPASSRAKTQSPIGYAPIYANAPGALVQQGIVSCRDCGTPIKNGGLGEAYCIPCTHARTAAAAARQSAQVLVDRAPTTAMKQAGARAIYGEEEGRDQFALDAAGECWQAMLDAQGKAGAPR